MSDEQKPEQLGPWKRLKRQKVYSNPWIDLYHDDVLNPAGKPGIYGVVSFKNLAVGVIPLDEQGNTWLVGQYRYSLGSYSWEIPEGGCPLGLQPLQEAQRELKEETGLSANHWRELMQMHLSNSVCNEAGIIYVATGLQAGEPEQEDTEDITVKKLPFAEAVDMVLQGEITDVMSVAGILRLALEKGVKA